ncbi:MULTISPECIES: LysR family transcriptional regulator [Acinetobacter]|uniref:LysR family transcriptional regulator n=2 Tax=Acinetobacter TaxID=469 RepID=A0A2H9YNT8_9GAMM|nr:MULTISPECIES: LysR family transcriptional regulator [Acinetobacter]MDM1337043.1 LysR family transcriptional regulator [Acinetobacter pseudolwoffii]MDM1342421.1 LysR family transcriptional regulator [Acinetobacter pseudolwoffii]MDM1345122.1 LysR family transcriptional regulator [Acinetobacter pseudolwoffii]PJO74318.1 LysR family transcriptional regulator [Acinetobacter pseudolwoffii]UBX53927.1 LysR family transcriptional regulator [Acinetobacter pseudolwoffii]
MDHLQKLQIYVRVVETQSFTHTAETLGVHRPLISKAIKQLEHELGVRLLNRTTRKVSMTLEGEAFYHKALQLLKDFDAIFNSFQPNLQTQNISGKLRINVPITIAKAILIPHLAEFKQQYPNIELILESSDSLVDLIDQGVDFAIRLGYLDDSTLIAKSLGQVEMITCAAPSYLKKYGTPHTLDDLKHHQAINYFSGKQRKVMNWQFIVNQKLEEYKLDSSILVNDSESFLSAALHGLGLIQGVRHAIQPYLENGQLIEVLSTYQNMPKPISLLYTHREHLPARMQVFIDWIERIFARDCDKK